MKIFLILLLGVALSEAIPLPDDQPANSIEIPEEEVSPVELSIEANDDESVPEEVDDKDDEEVDEEVDGDVSAVKDPPLPHKRSFIPYPSPYYTYYTSPYYTSPYYTYYTYYY